MKKIIIDRETWLRGEGKDNSFLLRGSDKKMCCLGFYFNQCGVSEETLLNKGSPMCLGEANLPKETLWLRGVAGTLMAINDSTYYPEADRESKIKKIFAEFGYKVKFR